MRQNHHGKGKRKKGKEIERKKGEGGKKEMKWVGRGAFTGIFVPA